MVTRKWPSKHFWRQRLHLPITLTFTWMRLAAGFLLFSKCFWRCCSCTFSAKPEPRMPWNKIQNNTILKISKMKPQKDKHYVMCCPWTCYLYIKKTPLYVFVLTLPGSSKLLGNTAQRLWVLFCSKSTEHYHELTFGIIRSIIIRKKNDH